MMYSAYKFHKQSGNIQPWRTPFPIWNQSVVPCPVLTVAFWSAYRFLKRQVRWSGIPISFRIFRSLLWSTQSKALAYRGTNRRYSKDTFLIPFFLFSSCLHSSIYLSKIYYLWVIGLRAERTWKQNENSTIVVKSHTSVFPPYCEMVSSLYMILKLQKQTKKKGT